MIGLRMSARTKSAPPMSPAGATTSTPMTRSISAIVASWPAQNADALAGLAKVYLKSGDAVRAEQTIALVSVGDYPENLS